MGQGISFLKRKVDESVGGGPGALGRSLGPGGVWPLEEAASAGSGRLQD